MPRRAPPNCSRWRRQNPASALQPRTGKRQPLGFVSDGVCAAEASGCPYHEHGAATAAGLPLLPLPHGTRAAGVHRSSQLALVRTLLVVKAVALGVLCSCVHCSRSWGGSAAKSLEIRRPSRVWRSAASSFFGANSTAQHSTAWPWECRTALVLWAAPHLCCGSSCACIPALTARFTCPLAAPSTPLRLGVSRFVCPSILMPTNASLVDSPPPADGTSRFAPLAPTAAAAHSDLSSAAAKAQCRCSRVSTLPAMHRPERRWLGARCLCEGQLHGVLVLCGRDASSAACRQADAGWATGPCMAPHGHRAVHGSPRCGCARN